MVAGRGGLEGLAVGDGGGRVANGHEQIAAQDEQLGPVRARGVGAHRLQQFQGVAVGPEAGLDLRRPQHERHRPLRIAGVEQVVTDHRRRGVERLQSGGGVAMHLAAAMRGKIGQEGVPHEPVPEAIAGLRGFDDAGGQRRVEVTERLVVGRARQRDELIGVERGADDRDALEGVARRTVQPRDHGGADRLRRRQIGCDPACQLDRGERHAARHGLDLGDRRVRRRRRMRRDDGPDLVILQGRQVELDRPVPVDQTRPHVVEIRVA